MPIKGSAVTDAEHHFLATAHLLKGTFGLSRCSALGEAGDRIEVGEEADGILLVEILQRERDTAMMALEAPTLNGADGASLREESIADTVIRLKLENVQRS